MKYKKLYWILILWICSMLNSFAINTFLEKNILQIIEELNAEINKTKNYYNTLYIDLNYKIFNASKKLKKTSNINKQITLIIKKGELNEQLKELKLREQSDISKIRYLKGLQIIKILYEKTLSLDYHFATVSTFNEINKISNPNHYSEFSKLKEQLNINRDNKKGFNLTSILGKNIYTSVIHSFIALFVNNNFSKREKEDSLKKIECILDFTLRMHNDLNTIYFETAFLQGNNNNIIKDIERLFVNYTKPIEYETALKECRNNDDWDSIKDKLNVYIERLNATIANSEKQFKAQKMIINLKFSIDRLLQFIAKYNMFIDQSAKFYEKFAIMLNSYENDKQCASKIPLSYIKLKENIDISIDKFNTAYKPIEINGSKMKEVLYGINEYD